MTTNKLIYTVEEIINKHIKMGLHSHENRYIDLSKKFIDLEEENKRIRKIIKIHTFTDDAGKDYLSIDPLILLNKLTRRGNK